MIHRKLTRVRFIFKQLQITLSTRLTTQEDISFRVLRFVSGRTSTSEIGVRRPMNFYWYYCWSRLLRYPLLFLNHRVVFVLTIWIKHVSDKNTISSNIFFLQTPALACIWTSQLLSSISVSKTRSRKPSERKGVTADDFGNRGTFPTRITCRRQREAIKARANIPRNPDTTLAPGTGESRTSGVVKLRDEPREDASESYSICQLTLDMRATHTKSSRETSRRHRNISGWLVNYP